MESLLQSIDGMPPPAGWHNISRSHAGLLKLPLAMYQIGVMIKKPYTFRKPPWDPGPNRTGKDCRHCGGHVSPHLTCSTKWLVRIGQHKITCLNKAWTTCKASAVAGSRSVWETKSFLPTHQIWLSPNRTGKDCRPCGEHLSPSLTCSTRWLVRIGRRGVICLNKAWTMCTGKCSSRVEVGVRNKRSIPRASHLYLKH